MRVDRDLAICQAEDPVNENSALHERPSSSTLEETFGQNEDNLHQSNRKLLAASIDPLDKHEDRSILYHTPCCASSAKLLSKAIGQVSVENDHHEKKTARDASLTSPLHVSFDQVFVRKYFMDMGDHPNVAVGAPLSISWDYEQIRPQNIDIYELERRCDRPRRPREFLILDQSKRHDILLRLGYSEQEIEEAAQAAAKTKRKRQISWWFSHVQLFEELICSVRRKVTRLVRRLGITRNTRKETNSPRDARKKVIANAPVFQNKGNRDTLLWYCTYHVSMRKFRAFLVVMRKREGSLRFTWPSRLLRRKLAMPLPIPMTRGKSLSVCLCATTVFFLPFPSHHSSVSFIQTLSKCAAGPPIPICGSY